jgi:hypothetical protein
MNSNTAGQSLDLPWLQRLLPTVAMIGAPASHLSGCNGFPSCSCRHEAPGYCKKNGGIANLIIILFLWLIGFAYHFGLAMVPHDDHSFFRILDIPDPLHKSGVRLDLCQTSGGDEILKVCG